MSPLEHIAAAVERNLGARLLRIKIGYDHDTGIGVVELNGIPFNASFPMMNDEHTAAYCDRHVEWALRKLERVERDNAQG